MQPFSVHFESLDSAEALLDDDHVLAVMEFGAAPATQGADPRRIAVGLPQLGASPLIEAWTSETPVESGIHGLVSYSHNEQVLLGHISTDERDFPDVETATQETYKRFLPSAQALGFPHFLRIWNYIPDINGEVEGVERYKRFCVGRHAELERFEFPESTLPAASGVGSPAGEMLIYFLAARDAGIQMENPRQVSAFRYPPQYGPKSPSFSRAMVKTWGASTHLYVSGTASIVGHESLHGERVLEQLTESLHNMDTLVQSARAEHGLGIDTLAEFSQIKVYIREPRDYDAVRRHMHAQLDASVPVIYLGGDLCRKDLLVEVEGFYAG
jgi:chorismate lyase / 3-hydroxybenzoate synthase